MPSSLRALFYFLLPLLVSLIGFSNRFCCVAFVVTITTPLHPIRHTHHYRVSQLRSVPRGDDDQQQQHHQETPSTVLPTGALGPPEPIRSLPLGARLPAFRRKDRNSTERHDFDVYRIAHDPPIYLLKNFLSSVDCQAIQTAAQSQTMQPAETVSVGDTASRKHCQVAWLGPQPSLSLPQQKEQQETRYWDPSFVAQALVPLFLSPVVRQHPASSVEDLQVLEYQTAGEFVLHHDGAPRVLTVIYYLNGVAGTWFPLAQETMSESSASSASIILNKAQAMQLCQGLTPGKDGVLVGTMDSSDGDGVPVQVGDAVAFFNYRDDGLINWKAIHAGLPVHQGVKWIANHWFRYGGYAE